MNNDEYKIILQTETQTPEDIPFYMAMFNASIEAHQSMIQSLKTELKILWLVVIMLIIAMLIFK